MAAVYVEARPKGPQEGSTISGAFEGIPRAFRQAGLHDFFLEIILEKMRLLFLRLGLDEAEQPAFLAIAAEISAQLKGLDGEDRQREIVRYMAELKKTGQVSRLRDIMQ